MSVSPSWGELKRGPPTQCETVRLGRGNGSAGFSRCIDMVCFVLTPGHLGSSAAVVGATPAVGHRVNFFCARAIFSSRYLKQQDSVFLSLLCCQRMRENARILVFSCAWFRQSPSPKKKQNGGRRAFVVRVFGGAVHGGCRPRRHLHTQRLSTASFFLSLGSFLFSRRLGCFSPPFCF